MRTILLQPNQRHALELVNSIDFTGRFYTVAVGKLNPSKLANFPEIDVFVIVSCPENSLLDSRDFYRPVITPFELELALNVERTWTGEYSTDFRQLMQPGNAGCTLLFYLQSL